MIQEIAYKDPCLIFSLFAKQDGALLLESAQLRAQCGCFSFIALDPFAQLISKNGSIKFNKEVYTGDPFILLKEQLAKFTQENNPDLPPFQGGVAGFFSYDLNQHLENLPIADIDDLQFPDMALGFYDLVIGFDEVSKRAWIFSSGYPEQNIPKRVQRAKQRMDWLLRILDNLPTELPLSKIAMAEGAIQSNFTEESYQLAVKQVKEYILAGDIFEANIAQRFQVNLPADFPALHLYQQLRLRNPAPFAAYINLADTFILSASPERFLKLSGRQVEARPIKGTRKRGNNKEEDDFFAQELMSSEKDHAENVMIVDLLRNDLSRVCEDHSIDVLQLCQLESYATVHHLVSVITGKLQPNLTAVDLLKAAFPCGSITGAPKIRVMEIIAEIEPTVRGPYCGSIGYIGFNGDMDTAVTIRTFAIKNNIATFQAGGAIVVDSDPLAEYEETLIKAQALRESLL